MGKKIKKGKHFGDRNPLKQREEREKKLLSENKINKSPTSKDEQEVSKRFRNFIKLKQSVKDGDKKIGKRVTMNDDFEINKGLDKKMMNESNRQHLRRVEQVIHKKKAEAEFAKKFNVQIIRDEHGQIKMKKDPLSVEKKKKQSKIDPKLIEEIKKKKEAEDKEKIPTFPLVKYQMSAKMKRKLDSEDFIKPDVFKFGEVVKEPPSFKLSQKPNQKASKTGKRDFLFLKHFENK